MTDDEKELKDQRVVTMMSPSELEAIDDWMFKSRIRSRGEAIRRLCQIGLVFDEHAPSLWQGVAETVDEEQKFSRSFSRFFVKKDSNPSVVLDMFETRPRLKAAVIVTVERMIALLRTLQSARKEDANLGDKMIKDLRLRMDAISERDKLERLEADEWRRKHRSDKASSE